MATTPTATTYALLGLLALRPWTTYELARQAERSLRWLFPRAERAVYSEAKRLADLGWASAEPSFTGRRRGTVYTITPAGRRALREWLAAPSAPLQLESEGLLRVFFAEQTEPPRVMDTLAQIRSDAENALAALAALAAESASGSAPFPERWATNAVAMRLGADIHRTVAAWARWTEEAMAIALAGGEPAHEQALEIFGDIARGTAAVSDEGPRPGRAR